MPFCRVDFSLSASFASIVAALVLETDTVPALGSQGPESTYSLGFPERMRAASGLRWRSSSDGMKDGTTFSGAFACEKIILLPAHSLLYSIYFSAEWSRNTEQLKSGVI